MPVARLELPTVRGGRSQAGRGKRLRSVGENLVVTTLAGHYSEDWETLWWVRADGRAAILTGQRQMVEPLRLLAVTVERRTGWSGVRAS